MKKLQEVEGNFIVVYGVSLFVVKRRTKKLIDILLKGNCCDSKGEAGGGEKRAFFYVCCCCKSAKQHFSPINFNDVVFFFNYFSLDFNWHLSWSLFRKMNIKKFFLLHSLFWSLLHLQIYFYSVVVWREFSWENNLPFFFRRTREGNKMKM